MKKGHLKHSGGVKAQPCQTVCKWSCSPEAEAEERGEEAEAAAAAARGAPGARSGRAEALAEDHVEHAEAVSQGAADHDCLQHGRVRVGNAQPK